ncbi:NAD(P)/FAD-dependent oxidoreductase [Flavobacterium sp.]|uniref:NAD(P)/FAD-dependent oxidoreductase n=1 Tax=Flavobacterium sp. TaxID=239 RepID=UPI00345D2515
MGVFFMITYDYIIVGGGLAGLAFAQYCRKNNRTFLLFEDGSQKASLIAGGLYNPVVLKRFTSIWNAQAQLQCADEFYRELATDLKCKLDYPLSLYRVLHSVEEQNNWFTAADKPTLSSFLATPLVHNAHPSIEAPFHLGSVTNCGYVDTKMLLQQFHHRLETEEVLIRESFNYGDIAIDEAGITYHEIRANHIVFAEGFGLSQNPFFHTLPLDGTKGELLVIRAPELKLDAIYKSGVFIFPLGNDHYKVGATYDWQDKTDVPTPAAREELVQGLKAFIKVDFEVVAHFAGVRPTVKDRRPLVGTHPLHTNVHILNGMGTRGVLLAPAMAKALFESIVLGIPLDPHVDIQRFKHFYAKPYRN